MHRIQTHMLKCQGTIFRLFLLKDGRYKVSSWTSSSACSLKFRKLCTCAVRVCGHSCRSQQAWSCYNNQADCRAWYPSVSFFYACTLVLYLPDRVNRLLTLLNNDVLSLKDWWQELKYGEELVIFKEKAPKTHKLLPKNLFSPVELAQKISQMQT